MTDNLKIEISYCYEDCSYFSDGKKHYDSIIIDSEEEARNACVALEKQPLTYITGIRVVGEKLKLSDIGLERDDNNKLIITAKGD